MPVDFPEELWPDEAQRRAVQEMILAFGHEPLIITDRLANVVYASEAAERLLGDRAEALVNRVAFSLMGFDQPRMIPAGLQPALLAEGKPWYGLVGFYGIAEPGLRRVDASAIKQGGQFVAGVVRISPRKAQVR